MNNQGLNMAAVIASNSFYIGGNWGFVLKNNADYDVIYKTLKSAGDLIEILELKNGIIVKCDPEYLYQVISQVEEIGNDVLEIQKIRPQFEVQEFQKFLTQVLRGNSKYASPVSNVANAFKYTIGIYSCNNMHKIRLNGVVYPAYSLTLREMHKELLKLSKHKTVSIISKYGNIIDIGLVKSDDLLDALEISNTLTGVFISIIVEER